MKKKKNAFTLIELLAIIVILAIIAVITVPIILNIIENSRRGAATDSAYGFKDSINKYYVTELANNRQLQLEGPYTVTNGVLNGSGISNKEIPVSGDKPSSGYLNYTNNTLTTGCLVIGDYAVTFEGGNATSTIKGVCSSSSNNSGNEQGNNGNEQSSNTPVIQYGFKSVNADTGEETEIIPGTSGYAATNRHVYLKYNLTEETTPEACVYNTTNLQESCLTFGEENYSANVNEIKAFFGFNEDTWTQINAGTDEEYWTDPTGKKSCYCTNLSCVTYVCKDDFFAEQTNDNNEGHEGLVLVEEDTGIRCLVSKDGAWCDWP